MVSIGHVNYLIITRTIYAGGTHRRSAHKSPRFLHFCSDRSEMQSRARIMVLCRRVQNVKSIGHIVFKLSCLQEKRDGQADGQTDTQAMTIPFGCTVLSPMGNIRETTTRQSRDRHICTLT